MSLYAKKLRARALVMREPAEGRQYARPDRPAVPHWYLHDGHWHATRPLWVRREEQER